MVIRCIIKPTNTYLVLQNPLHAYGVENVCIMLQINIKRILRQAAALALSTGQSISNADIQTE